jgi:hypothetical protein
LSEDSKGWYSRPELNWNQRFRKPVQYLNERKAKDSPMKIGLSKGIKNVAIVGNVGKGIAVQNGPQLIAWHHSFASEGWPSRFGPAPSAFLGVKDCP